MAAVVATYTINRKDVWGTRRAHNVTMALDTGDYAAGGVAVTPASCGLSVIDEVIVLEAIEVSATPTAHVAMYLPSTGKVRVFQTGTAADGPLNEKGAEAFGAGAYFRLLVIGY